VSWLPAWHKGPNVKVQARPEAVSWIDPSGVSLGELMLYGYPGRVNQVGKGKASLQGWLAAAWITGADAARKITARKRRNLGVMDA
jgi:hypothetical protein